MALMGLVVLPAWGRIRPMETIPEFTTSSLEQHICERARECWPPIGAELDTVPGPFRLKRRAGCRGCHRRGNAAADSEAQPAAEQRIAHIWGIAIYRAGHDD